MMRLLTLPRIYIRFSDELVHLTESKSGAEFRDTPHVAIETDDRGRRTVREVGSGARTTSGPRIVVVNPFAHPRLVVGDFEIAEALLRFALAKLMKNGSYRRPDIIVHPLRELAGGLSDIESRALVDLAASAGARQVGIHQGTELGAAEVAEFQRWRVVPT